MERKENYSDFIKSPIDLKQYRGELEKIVAPKDCKEMRKDFKYCSE